MGEAERPAGGHCGPQLLGDGAPDAGGVGEQVEGARRDRLWSVWKVEPAGDAAGLDVV